MDKCIWHIHAFDYHTAVKNDWILAVWNHIWLQNYIRVEEYPKHRGDNNGLCLQLPGYYSCFICLSSTCLFLRLSLSTYHLSIYYSSIYYIFLPYHLSAIYPSYVDSSTYFLISMRKSECAGHWPTRAFYLSQW